MKPNPQTITTLATRFCYEIRATMSAECFAEMNRRNEGRNHPNVCHSHDFCDANEVMNQAFAVVFTREFDPASDADVSLWNAAWNLAKRCKFALRWKAEIKKGIGEAKLQLDSFQSRTPEREAAFSRYAALQAELGTVERAELGMDI